MLVVGLTGSIATGKTTVSAILAKRHHIPVIDADKLSRKVVEPGTLGAAKIRRHFGDDVFRRDGRLDRDRLGKIVFSSVKDRKILNGIIHPAVRFEILKLVLWYYIHGYEMVILDIPLLFESGLDKFCGKTVCVACTEETQLERLVTRDSHLSPEDANNRIQAQMPISAKINRADVVIWNECDKLELEEKVARMVRDHSPGRLLTWLELAFPVIAGVRALWILLWRAARRRNLL